MINDKYKCNCTITISIDINSTRKMSLNSEVLFTPYHDRPTCQWTVSSFTKLDYFEHASFSFYLPLVRNQPEFKFTLVPRGYYVNFEILEAQIVIDYKRIYEQIPEVHREANAHFQVSLINGSGVKCHKREAILPLYGCSVGYNKSKERIIIAYDYLLNSNNDLLRNDSLIIFIEGKVGNQIKFNQPIEPFNEVLSNVFDAELNWTIDRIKDLEDIVESDRFDLSFEARMHFYPRSNGHSSAYSDCACVDFLCVPPESAQMFSVRYRVSIFNGKDKDNIFVVDGQAKYQSQKLVCNSLILIQSNYLLDPANGFTTNNRLTLLCQIKIL